MAVIGSALTVTAVWSLVDNAAYYVKGSPVSGSSPHNPVVIFENKAHICCQPGWNSYKLHLRFPVVVCCLIGNDNERVLGVDRGNPDIVIFIAESS